MSDSFNISDFRTSIQKTYHRVAHFNMELPIPEGLRNAESENLVSTKDPSRSFASTNRILHFNIETAFLPGIAFGTDENRRYGYGPTRLKPYVGIYDTIPITVRSDSEGKIYDFFQSWMKLIFNSDTRAGFNGAVGFSNQFGLSMPYEISYKQDYVTFANINVYDEEGGDPTIKLRLHNCFPIHLGNVSLDWNDPGIMKFPVTLTFSDWWNERKIMSNTVSQQDLPPLPANPANGDVAPLPPAQVTPS
jgi:T4-like virus tail tube protein gp19.